MIRTSVAEVGAEAHHHLQAEEAEVGVVVVQRLMREAAVLEAVGVQWEAPVCGTVVAEVVEAPRSGVTEVEEVRQGLDSEVGAEEELV